MIAFVEGVVVALQERSVVVQTGGFGVEVFAPKATLVALSVGAAVRLHTHFLVKEDQLALYGFHDPDMLRLFSYLISVSGVGPKLALAMLSALPTALLATGIVQGDAGLLASAPGVGKKMAERIILELKNKLPEELQAPGAAKVGGVAILSDAATDATEALLALGYRESQVKSTVAEMALQDADATAEALIRKALAKLR